MSQAETPLYQRIANDLRERIRTGRYAEGDKIPAERELIDEFETTRPTVRAALELLTFEGWIYSDRPRGTFVRKRPPLRVRSRRHYRYVVPGETTSPFARDAEREGKRPDWDFETTHEPASAEVAERLGVDVGDEVARTEYLFKADDEPVMLSTSWEPLALTRGTRIEDPEGPGRITGVIARFDAIGIRIERVVERVGARAATTGERERLRMDKGIWLVTIRRVQYAGAMAVETTDIAIPADRYVLEYDVPVMDAPAGENQA